LRRGEIQAKEITTAAFDKKKFKEALAAIKELAFIMPDDFAQQLQNICANCGVALFSICSINFTSFNFFNYMSNIFY
jgi:hypothetical protein